LKAGDIIYNQTGADEWAAVKILVVDIWPDESECFHCLSYKPTATPPTLENIDALEILIYHAPISSSDFKQNWKVLGSKSISDADLVGFIEYLKHTNFPRYIEFTKQNSDELISKANAHYREAYALGDRGKKQESIAEYSKAIDLFPLFFEAIDNRAFTYMELGDFVSAIHDFEASLGFHPDGNAAFFSRGECFLKMDKLDEAEKIFLQGMHKFREHQATYQKFLDIVKAKKRLVDKRSAKSLVQPASVATPKPAIVPPKKWWQFWA
jgi:tetratricopeptide (TPR) repeat protein